MDEVEAAAHFRTSRPSLARWAGRGLLVVGALLLGYWGWASWDAHRAQQRMTARLASVQPLSEAGLVDSATETREEVKVTGMIGRIDIDRLGLTAMVLDGTSRKALRQGVGHLENSPYPGEMGNVTLAAHRDTYFRDLRKLEPGDRVRLTTPDGVFNYAVDSLWIVPPSRTDLLGNFGGRTLTLVTCHPFAYVGPAPDRFIARATLLP